MRHTSPQHPCRSIHCSQAGGVLPVVIIIVALAVSIGIFFVFTRPGMKPEDVTGGTTPPAQKVAKAAPAAPVVPATPKSAIPKAPLDPKQPSFGFARPMDLGKEMVRSLMAGDYNRAGALAAAADPQQAKAATQVFEQMMKVLKAKVGLEDQIELLGLVENKTRLSIPFILPGSDTPVRLQLDVERDDKMGWKISHLQLPKELAGAAIPAPSPHPPAPATTDAAKKTKPLATPGIVKPAPPKIVAKHPLFSVEESPDALTFGSDFVRALLKHDFVEASKYVDEKKVPAERLVGLCIVFEEGEYEFKPTKPLIITVANPEVSWVIAQVQSQKLQQSTEFGLEMQRSGTDQPWKVVGLNLSEILSSFASSAAKMGVPYTPIVSNPKGGESLALYFEYDQEHLHSRAQKQLEIVAGLLKSDPSKKLHIAGHTDAKGTDNYNLRLSQSRAESVKKQLESLGVPPEQVVTMGLGKAQPLGPNQKADGTDDPEGRSKNRRAEIYLDF